MKTTRYIAPICSLLLALVIVTVSREAAADIVFKTRKDKSNEVQLESEDGAPPASACQGYTDPLTPPPGAGKHLVTITLKGSGGAADKNKIAILQGGETNGSECGHTHPAGQLKPAGPNVACHRYVYQNGQWTLVHICP